MPIRFGLTHFVLALGLAGFSGCQAPPPATAPSAAAPAAVDPAVKYMAVNGTRLPYVERGQGVPVVFVHGAVSDHRTWERHAQGIAGQYRAIAYTQRYFGAEAWDRSGPPFGEQTHADDLAAFIRGLGAGPVHLVAWSYSGHVALLVAARHPELVRSAFVYEPAFPSYVDDPAIMKAIGADAAAAFGDAAKASQAGDNAAAVRLLVDHVGERDGYFAALPPAAQQVMLDSAPTMPGLFADGKPPPLSCQDLGRIKPPVAVVRGDRVRPFFRHIADAAGRCLPGNRQRIVPNARHMWPGEEPLAFDAMLVDFLQRL